MKDQQIDTPRALLRSILYIRLLNYKGNLIMNVCMQVADEWCEVHLNQTFVLSR